MTYAEAVKDLGKHECCCGTGKEIGFPFCLFCWRQLPKELQQRIYKHIYGGKNSNAGYEKTISEAREVLAAANPQLPDLQQRPASDLDNATAVRDESTAEGVQANHGL